MGKYNFDEIIPRENTACVKYDLRKNVFQNESVIPMWVADMDFKTPDFIINALKQRLEHEILGYSIRNPEFEKVFIDWVFKRHNWEIKKEWIIYTPGVVPALAMMVLAFTQPKDKIIIQPPVYSPFMSVVKDNNRELVLNPLILSGDRYIINFSELENLLKKGAKMLLFSHPHNPVGRVWNYNELADIAALCLKYNCILVSDEIHCDLTFPPMEHIPAASIAKDYAANIITCMSPTKTFNMAGVSASAIIISNPEMHRKYVHFIETQHLHIGNVFSFIAFEAAYRYGEPWLNELLPYLKNNILELHQFCKTYTPAIQPNIPEATYLVWLDCRALQMDDAKLKNFFINKAGIGLNDGVIFGPGGNGFARINIACPNSLLQKVFEKLKSAYHTI